jgi:hypothetical protein
MEEEPTPMRGLRWRVAASIVVVFGWIIFILLYAAFPPANFTFQNVVIALVSIVVGIMILAALWASFGMGFARYRRYWH